MKKPQLIVLSFMLLMSVIGCHVSEKHAAQQTIPVHISQEDVFQQSEMVLRQHRMEQFEHDKWVVKCIHDFDAIKPGMTRQDVEERFPMDGGLQGVSPVRFLHPECNHFKVDVSFSYETNPSNQNRAIGSGTDVVVGVSKPYVEHPATD